MVLVDTYDDAMKTVLEPLGGSAQALGTAREINFGPTADDPVASKKHLKQMYNPSNPPSSASSSRQNSGRSQAAQAAGRELGGAVQVEP